MSDSKHVTYEDAGVDTAEGGRAVDAIKQMVKDTNRSEVIGGIGGFGGLFSAAALKDMEDPILISGTDGVGTKLKIAMILDKHDTIGIDCVAMCVNDVICAGAKPLVFLDYIACGKNYPGRIADIVSGITEGGVLGATLLLDHWFSLSPAVSGFVLNLLCYGWGWRLLGRSFIAYSLIATVGFSLPYKLYELFPPLWPQLAEMPLLAAVVGALFVGVGAGLSVRAGGASGGDDALAMCIAHVTGMGIQWAYLSTDLVVLGLSLTYIPLRRIGYSLLTVLISGQLIGLVQRLPLPWDKPRPEAAE